MKNGEKMIQQFDSSSGKCFYLGNEALCCILCIRHGQAELLHFGAPILPEDAEAVSLPGGLGWGCSVLYDQHDPASCLDVRALAWSASGTGDYREAPIALSFDGQPTVPDFVFSSAQILPEMPAYSYPMPHARGKSETLELVFRSRSTLLTEETTLTLYLSLFETALVRRAVLKNGSERPVTVTKMMSSMTDLKGSFRMMSFHGSWSTEMHLHTVPVERARTVNENVSGFSSNRSNPGFILAGKETGEDAGEAYGFNLIWSGNHYASAQRSEQGLTRVMQGISPDNFAVTLEKDASFETPEAVLSWSGEGLNGLSERMHRFVNEHIVPPYWQYRERPVLYNDWEGCMFSFNEAKLLSLARKAVKLGCELFVLDDGWFGERNSDTAGLGDYTVNRTKLPGGLEGLSRKIHALGLDFGLWFEPEAVNPDSELYRAHPEWALHSHGTEDVLSRNELLLDLTRPEVRDYIVSSVSAILDSADIQYVKWDMNRHSAALGEKAYAYILGLYEVLDRIFSARPQILLEGCASGGNRFDLGMLCYAPQIWASDDTDPIERLDIQNGLSYLYPVSTVGAHISASPNMQTLRATPLSTRANTAFFGAFGIEMDLGHLLPVEEQELKECIEYYLAHRKTFQFGTFRRCRTENDAVCWQVSRREETIAALFHRLIHAGPGYEWLYVSGLEEKTGYTVKSRLQGLRVGQFGALVKHIAPVELNPNGVVLHTADKYYRLNDATEEFACSGAALRAGIPLSPRFTGTGYREDIRVQGDFLSNIYLITKQNQE